jgi:hypothetical protein
MLEKWKENEEAKQSATQKKDDKKEKRTQNRHLGS